MASAQAQSMDDLVQVLENRYPITSVKTHGDFDIKKKDELGGARRQIGPILK
jgi:hypothetical protein